MRFRDKYYKELINNPKVHVFLNANLTDVQNENKRISGLQLSSYNGIKASVKRMNMFLLWVVLKIADTYYGFTKNIKIILFIMTHH